MAVVTDIRIQDTFFDNRKIVKLKRRHGAEALLCLIRLWMYTAKNAPKGILFDMDDDDIEIAAGWAGEPGALVRTLIELVLLEKDHGIASIHDWEDCQPWAFKSDIRSARAQKGGIAKAEKLLQADNKHASSSKQADNKHAGSNAPFLSSPFLSSPIPSNTPPQAEPAGDVVPLALDLGPAPMKTNAAKERFEKFWAVVRKKVGKKMAMAEFLKVNPDDALLEKMIRSMTAYNKSNDDVTKLKDPERWIKGERWNDELLMNGGGDKAPVSNAWKGAEN